MEPVWQAQIFVNQPIQNNDVPRRQRSSHTGWWRNAEVGVLHYKSTSLANSIADSDWNLSGDKLADWVYDVYRGGPGNVRCMMGYIVNLTVILDDIFRTAGGSVTGNAAQEVMDTHVRSWRRDSIHRDIRRIVAETFSIRFATPEKDLFSENIVSLIRQYCSPHQILDDSVAIPGSSGAWNGKTTFPIDIYVN